VFDEWHLIDFNILLTALYMLDRWFLAQDFLASSGVLATDPDQEDCLILKV
jgi:hypothetical protein